MAVNAALILVVGILIFIHVYYLRIKKIDRYVMKCDPSIRTPADRYNDGVEFFPTNKNVLFGFQFKSIAGLAPVVGAIVAGLLWGWLPALIWILVGNIFIGWVQDYFSCMMSVRKDGKSLGPLSYELISPRTRNILLIFLLFYLILLMAAFSSLAAVMLSKNINYIIPTATVLLAGVLVGLKMYRLKMDPIIATSAGIVLIVGGIWAGSLNMIPNPIGGRWVIDFPYFGTWGIQVPNIWLTVLLAICLVAALTSIWKFTQPTIYMFFYVVLFGIIALAATLIFGNHVYLMPEYTEFFAGMSGTAAMPLWPLLFVTIACGSISGWHSLVSSSATSKQIDKETDVAPVTAGSMLAEGMLALLALSIVATLSVADTTDAHGNPLSAADIFSKGAANLLGGSDTANAYVGLIFVALALAVMILIVRLGRLTIHEIGGEKIPLLRNKIIASVLFLAATFFLASPNFGGTWIYIWVLFGGSNQLMAGLSLMIITLWLIDTKKGWMISGIPGVFMIVTSIAALSYVSYQSLTRGFTSLLVSSETFDTPSGNIVAGIIGIILIIAAIIMCYDIFMAFKRRKDGINSGMS
ncbi:MAG: hypothetical protein O8C66_04115 [Candidatus Methanoperedens sp.]|nr:hypothetical protein [Candidatus Methanoperedens sp.]MCZ7369673.1 hypothetical protein [Candidatus Methanoperedens sp.]